MRSWIVCHRAWWTVLLVFEISFIITVPSHRRVIWISSNR
jgi:hypothetical protein